MDNVKKLKPYFALANMIADSLGNRCEVVIHDLSTPQNSVVHVANGLITGRKVGQSFDHLVKQVLLSKKFQNDYTANYTFSTESGKEIKSSTSLIRDENDEVIGAFCINIEVDDLLKFQDFLNGFLMNGKESEEENTPVEENSIGSVAEVIDDIINKTIAGIDVSTLKRKDSIDLLSFMYDKGIFLTKGSIDKVATVMNISPVTVYSYLDEIKKKSKKKKK